MVSLAETPTGTHLLIHGDVLNRLDPRQALSLIGTIVRQTTPKLTSEVSSAEWLQEFRALIDAESPHCAFDPWLRLGPYGPTTEEPAATAPDEPETPPTDLLAPYRNAGRRYSRAETTSSGDARILYPATLQHASEWVRIPAHLIDTTTDFGFVVRRHAGYILPGFEVEAAEVMRRQQRQRGGTMAPKHAASVKARVAQPQDPVALTPSPKVRRMYPTND
jgi:hypothetical protein